MESLKKYMHGPGSVAEVFKVALPLVLSTSVYTAQLFINRMFLMWYDSTSMSASMYSGILGYTIFALFSGTAIYVNTFVAQYEGAKLPRRVGASMWQGIYFAIVSGALLMMLAPFAGDIVRFAKHDPAVQIQEAIYLRILLLGGIPYLLTVALSCFYTGRSKTWTILWVDASTTIANCILDYILIFGKFGLAKMGIAGAGWATVIASTLACLIYLFLFLRPRHQAVYASLSDWRFDPELFRRLLKFGVPSGLHFMLDLIGFTLFLTFVGRISTTALTATSMAFQINTLAFMPMVGFATAVGTLVGRELGANRADLAARSTWSATLMTMAYMLLVAIGYVLVPDLFMFPFAAEANAADMQTVRPIVIILLWFVAFYCIFDTGNLIFSAAVKAAGDTRFVMIVSVVLNWIVLVIPAYLAVKYVAGLKGLYIAWAAATAYVSLLGFTFFLRFLGGKWKSMRVIESIPCPPEIITSFPASEL